MEKKISVLGTEYSIMERHEKEDLKLAEVSGYCDDSTKEIVVAIPEDDPMNKGNLEQLKKKILRHEIVHAFLAESGLDASSTVFDGAWATNEEMVDWFAIQSPKIFLAYNSLGLL